MSDDASLTWRAESQAEVCVECGLPEGRRHRCPAHPRPPGMGVLLFAFFGLPLILVPLVGPTVMFAFLPWFLFAWWVKTR
jgi:hypothetical protein